MVLRCPLFLAVVHPNRDKNRDRPPSGMIDSDSPLTRLLGWLSSQGSWISHPLHKDHSIKPGIEEILDLYIAHGPHDQVQTAFNALAARHKDYGRVPLRLRVRPRDFPSLERALRDSFEALRNSANPKLRGGQKALTSAQLDQKARADDVVSAVERAIQKGSLTSAFSRLRLSRTAKVSLQPTLVGAVTNPVFDLWLVLLDPELAGRVRRCLAPQCGEFFAAWPQKKTYCSEACRNRFWNRPRRAASPSSRTR